MFERNAFHLSSDTRALTTAVADDTNLEINFKNRHFISSHQSITYLNDLIQIEQEEESVIAFESWMFFQRWRYERKEAGQ